MATGLWSRNHILVTNFSKQTTFKLLTVDGGSPLLLFRPLKRLNIMFIKFNTLKQAKNIFKFKISYNLFKYSTGAQSVGRAHL